MTALFKYKPTITIKIMGSQLILLRRIILLQKKELKNF